MKGKEYTNYSKWRGRIMRANIYMVAIIFTIEILMYFLLKHRELISQTLPVYLLRFLIIPTVCNLTIILGEKWFAQRMDPDDGFVNYIPSIQMSLICMVLAMTHYVFSVTLSVFCFPIFITVLFNDKRMTQRITELNLVLLLGALLIRNFDPLAPPNDIFLVPEGVVASIIILSTNVVCRILTDFQEEKDIIIERAYRSQIEMQEQLNRDQKTGLYGANALSNALHAAVEIPDDRPLILAVIDIDNFKNVNDNYGHAQGDKVLNRLAGLMMRDGSGDIFPARFGGEEFAVIFRISMTKADEWVEELRLKFAAQKYEFMTERVTISSGIAAWEPGWSDEQLFINADSAMYCSKQHGKNMVTVFSKRCAEM